jgi:hypothetical protein
VRYLTSTILLIAAIALPAQDFRHQLSIGPGGGFPVFARSRSLWEDSAALDVAYGVRIKRALQADFGFTRTFSPADKQFDPLEFTERRELGGGRIDSWRFGGRWVFSERGRLQLSAGIGAIRQHFTAPQLAFGPELDESGWGVYALGSVSWRLDGAGRFRIGVTPRLELVQARTAWLHRNRSLFVPVEVVFRF